jgi:hypothetical protein
MARLPLLPEWKHIPSVSAYCVAPLLHSNVQQRASDFCFLVGAYARILLPFGPGDALSEVYKHVCWGSKGVGIPHENCNCSGD